jgi:arginine-tRNA-protein transferase
VLDEHAPPTGDAFPCPYLPGRTARNLTLSVPELPGGLYHAFMDLNFRRMGAFVYRPECPGCRECRMLRVRAPDFRPSRAQRRCAARNADLTVEVGEPAADPERERLYAAYLAARHDGQMDGSPEELRNFLYASRVATLEFSYRLEGRLVAVGIADAEPDAWSAVYCYFDPRLGARSLGVYNVLRLIAECQGRGVEHVYLGYYVAASARMSYKASYRPCEILGPGGEWSPCPK